MKDEAYEMKGGIISKLKRLRLFSISVCLLCSAIWILCLKNSIANKKIYDSKINKGKNNKKVPS